MLSQTVKTLMSKSNFKILKDETQLLVRQLGKKSSIVIQIILSHHSEIIDLDPLTLENNLEVKM